jgi:hypothetical protein
MFGKSIHKNEGITNAILHFHITLIFYLCIFHTISILSSFQIYDNWALATNSCMHFSNLYSELYTHHSFPFNCPRTMRKIGPEVPQSVDLFSCNSSIQVQFPPSLYGTNNRLEDTVTSNLTSLPHHLSSLYLDTPRHVNLNVF